MLERHIGMDLMLKMRQVVAIDWSKTLTRNYNPLQWSRFARTCLANQDRVAASTESVVLSGTIPHLEFTLEIQSNKLTYEGNPYTENQQFLYTLIKCLQDKGYGYRRIAHKSVSYTHLTLPTTPYV
mgnify:CR=1 FL=1